MTRRQILGSTAVTAAVIGTFLAFAQPAPPPLANFMPPGPLLYLEAKNFGTLLSDWNGAAENRAWLASANYQAFSRSHLFLRLGQAQTEFATAAGVPPDFALLSAVAGGNSSLAMYNIGSLEFLYITRLESARALNTSLWKARGSYQTRTVAGTQYYVKEDKPSQRLAAFAYTNGLLVLATKEELITGALQRIAQTTPQPGQTPPANQAALTEEPWFSSAVQAAAPGSSDLRLVYNLDRLIKTPQFRSYWVQRNGAALAEYSSGLADLERSSGTMQERRVLLRSTPSADLAASEPAAGQLLALVPDGAGLYRAWAQPTSDDAARWIEDHIFASTVAQGPRARQAPGVMQSADAGSEQDLETRIDEIALSDDRGALAFQSLRERLAAVNLQAMLQISNTRVAADGVFVRPQAAIVLEAAAPWDGDAVRASLSSAVDGWWTNAGLGANWRAASNGIQELDGLGRIALAIDGRRLILGDSPELVAAIVARRNQTAAPGAVYAAGWRHAQELPNFERMTRLIDFPQIQPGADPGSREPAFYSENMASLGRALQRLQSATIAVHDSGPLVRESVVYRLGP